MMHHAPITFDHIRYRPNTLQYSCVAVLLINENERSPFDYIKGFYLYTEQHTLDSCWCIIGIVRWWITSWSSGTVSHLQWIPGTRHVLMYCWGMRMTDHKLAVLTCMAYTQDNCYHTYVHVFSREINYEPRTPHIERYRIYTKQEALDLRSCIVEQW